MTPVFWLVGLSGSGKTTLGSLLRIYLQSQDYDAEFIDADRFRIQHGFHGFSREQRIQNIDAMRDLVLSLNDQGKICVVSAITPYACMRDLNREYIPFYREVWVRCGLETLTSRDTKGFYAKASKGLIKNFTGFTDDFDEPKNADLILDTDVSDLSDSYLLLRNFAEHAIHEGNLLHSCLSDVIHFGRTEVLNVSFG
ncbi:MAG: adenylyl-sulfate kinase [Desulfovibrio sp.]|nr:adenylyl-sulfate kinase [Desulfovibrio sp.]